MPATQLEVVMQRCHPQDTFANSVPEVAHLQHHRNGLGNKNSAHHHQHDFLADDHRDGASDAPSDRAPTSS